MHSPIFSLTFMALLAIVSTADAVNAAPADNHPHPHPHPNGAHPRAATHTVTHTVTRTVTAACTGGSGSGALATGKSSSTQKSSSSTKSASTTKASVAPATTAKTSTTKAASSTKASSSTKSSSAAASSSTSSAFQQVALHNAKRAIHNTPNLTWNQTLADYATTVAKKCVFAHSGGPYGENLATGYPVSSYGNEKLFDLWYAEGKGYNYSTNVFNEKTGHFTQVVWYNSKQIGCALVSCDAKSLGLSSTSGTDASYLVCEYSPPGNYAGQYTKNVLPANDQ